MTEYTLGLAPVEIAASAMDAVVIEHVGGAAPAAIAFGASAPNGSPSEGFVLGVGQSVALWDLSAAGVNVYGIGAGATLKVSGAATSSGVRALLATGDGPSPETGGVVIGAPSAIVATAGVAMDEVDLAAYVFPAPAAWRVGVARPLPAWMTLTDGVLAGTPAAPAPRRVVEVLAVYDVGAPVKLALDITVASA